MPHILVADQIAESGLERLRRAPGITFEVRQGLSPTELATVVGSFDGVLIRSAVKITREVLAQPGKLVVIARAGVGVDNVDVEAATAAGVLVLNTPDANTISTAEHTVAMLLALHRRIPEAHHHVMAGKWSRSSFQGDQLAGKVLGIIGLGRIGRAVAKRALAFDMKVLGYDPFVTAETVLDGTVRLVRDLAELLHEADCITLHATLSENTRHMIAAEQLAMMKRGGRLINCARGSLVDEAALADALNRGHLAGAAVDVYENEPPQGSPLLTAKNVVLTPHLAASTTEAQTQVSVDAVEALLAFLLHGEIRSAVNVTGVAGFSSPRAKAALDLCSRMGALIAPWCAGGVDRIRVTTLGESLQEVAEALSWQALVAVLSPHLEVRLNLVNAREQAKRRGISVEHASQSPRANSPESILLSVQTQGQSHDIEGTMWTDGKPRVLSIDGYRMEIVPERFMALIFNNDQPGVIGLVGQTLGDAGVNIADMALSRRGQTALMVLKLDEPMPEPVRESLRLKKPPILSVQTVSLPPIVGPSPAA